MTSPGFLMCEVERRFSIEHSENYTMVVIADIDLSSGRFTPYVHDGEIDESFALRPTRWAGTFPH
jgi:hypothetical protein